MKGFSITLIIAHHICGQLFHENPKWFSILSYQGVNAFFLLSGIGLTYSLLSKNEAKQNIHDWVNWYLKRSIRILPSYWIVLLTTFFLFLIGCHLLSIRVSKNFNLALFDFAAHFFLINIYFKATFYSINVAWWFLATIAHFYLFFPLLFNLCKNKKTRFSLVIFILLLEQFNRKFHFINGQISLSFVFFSTGIFLAFYLQDITEKFIKQYPFLLFVAFFCLSSALLCSLTDLIPNILGTYDFLLFSLFFVSFLYVVSFLGVDFLESRSSSVTSGWGLNGRLIAKTIRFVFEILGKNSYALFLIHWGFIHPVFVRFSNFFVGLFVFSAIILFSSIILTSLDNTITSFFSFKES